MWRELTKPTITPKPMRCSQIRNFTYVTQMKTQNRQGKRGQSCGCHIITFYNPQWFFHTLWHAFVSVLWVGLVSICIYADWTWWVKPIQMSQTAAEPEAKTNTHWFQHCNIHDTGYLIRKTQHNMHICTMGLGQSELVNFPQKHDRNINNILKRI